MQNVKSLIENFRLIQSSRLILAILVAVTVGLVIFSMSRVLLTPPSALLYGRLDANAMTQITAYLDTENVLYEVREDGLWVPGEERDRLRMALASRGLPNASVTGYEILDDLNGFGTTSQMFDAAYLRAREGELARTIAAADGIDWARVHLSSDAASRWGDTVEASASVLVQTRSSEIQKYQATAIKHLVAAAVAGLQPSGVSVINAQTGALIGEEQTPQAGAFDLADQLKFRAERMLDAHLGFGRSRVEVSVETERDSEQIFERKVDPSQKVEVSTENQEVTMNSEGTGSSAVTVASNVPNDDAAGGGAPTSSRNETETNARVNFDFSEVRREVVRNPGSINRISVAVLVDGVTETDAAGTETWRPRSEEELGDLRDLVGSAIGINEERGDRVTIKSLRFDGGLATLEAGAPASGGGIGQMPFRIAQLAVFTIAALAIAFFVLKPAILDRARYSLPELEGGGAAAEAEGNADGTGMAELDGSGAFGDDLPALPGMMDLPTFDTMDFDGEGGAGGERPIDRLVQSVGAKKEDSLEILRGWLETGPQSRPA
ncbi:flagellar basal-body MS-ring/collar protein FliF [Mangrovicoccus algicola]|uniref:Flagellar M-ring protein n=1 Tax=Mangrovicoccus algicola TaxID=2771008 RepID=A0A8J6YSM8_9RHOB|nr:flagellar basal-body MS-ring/collar protein FliF [Mangrovicoccus algicola]MBE3638403.1 flagellar M-ring protein FliF [Mangrovicoccus algicola]